MMPRAPGRLRWYTAAAHLLVGLIARALVRVSATPGRRANPALKAFTFGVSLALFLTSTAFVPPLLGVSATFQRTSAWTLAFTMIVEMLPITLQAARGTTSHFTMQGSFNSLMWHVMAAAIVFATVAMLRQGIEPKRSAKFRRNADIAGAAPVKPNRPR